MKEYDNELDVMNVQPFDKTIDLYKNPTLKNVCSKEHLDIDWTGGIEC